MTTIEELYDEEHRTLNHRCGWLNCSECLCTYCILGGKKFHYHNMSIICVNHTPLRGLLDAERHVLNLKLKSSPPSRQSIQ